MSSRGRQLAPGRFPPGARGNKAPADVIGRRRNMVETLYLRLQNVEGTARLLREHCKQLKIPAPSLSTVRRDVNRIRERWAREAEQHDAPDARELTLRSVLADLEQARLAKSWGSVSTLQRLVCEIRGLLVERKQVAIAHTNVSPLQGQPREVLQFVSAHKRLPDPEERAALGLPAAKKPTN